MLLVIADLRLIIIIADTRVPKSSGFHFESLGLYRASYISGNSLHNTHINKHMPTLFTPCLLSYPPEAHPPSIKD